MNEEQLRELLLTVDDDTQLGKDDLDSVNDEVAELAAEWRGMCTALGLLNGDEIAQTCFHVPKNCLTKVLSLWLNEEYNTVKHGLPTWRKLVEAVAKSTGGSNPALAKKIRENHRKESSEVQTESSGLGEQGLEPVLESMRQPQGNARSIQPTEDRDGSMPPQQQLEAPNHPSTSRRLPRKSESRNDSTTSTCSYEDWCCKLELYLKRDKCPQYVRSGVIVKLTSPPEELQSHFPGLKPSIDEHGPLQTSYVLITSHRTIPGMSDVPQWSLDIGLGKKHKLSNLVCGAVSCCGKDGIISSGRDCKPQREVFSPHQNSNCYLELDFTMLFLNEKFEKKIVNKFRSSVPEIDIDVPKFAEKHRLQLYQQTEREMAITPLQPESKSDLDTSSLAPQQLREEIQMHREFQLIHYTESKGQHTITQSSSGSPVVYYDASSEKATLVGIHVGESQSNGSAMYYAVTTYEIFQLLRGHPAAFFAVMEIPAAHRMWPSRWAHLLIHTLGTYGPREKPLPYLVEILHLLLCERKGLRLIDLRLDDPSSKIIPALHLLSALFKHFENSSRDMIAAAISGDEGVFTKDKEKEEFRKDMEKFSHFFICLNLWLIDSKTLAEVKLVEAYFDCYNNMLNFKDEGILQTKLYKDDRELLKKLQEKSEYASPHNKENFITILMKITQMMEDKDESQLQQGQKRQREQLETKFQKQQAALFQQQQEFKLHKEHLLQKQHESLVQQQKEFQEEIVTELQKQHTALLQQQQEEFKCQQKQFLFYFLFFFFFFLFFFSINNNI